MRASWWLALAIVPVLMAGEVGGPSGGFMAGIVGALAGIASAIRGWLAITASELLRLITYLKEVIIELSQQLVRGMFRLGQVTARAIYALGRMAIGGLRELAVWTYQNIRALSQWLREKFAPVLRFIARLKDEIRAIYNRYVRPIIDAIDFIRQLNRVLQIFHVDVLQSLDEKLGEIERRLKAPFLWIEQRLTEVQNIINRIVTLDGLVQRVTLLASMSRYAPSWVSGFWNSQIDRDVQHGDDYSRGRIYPHDEVWAPGKELALFYRGEGSRMDAAIDALVPDWRQAAGIDPPGPEELQ